MILISFLIHLSYFVNCIYVRYGKSTSGCFMGVPWFSQVFSGLYHSVLCKTRTHHDWCWTNYSMRATPI